MIATYRLLAPCSPNLFKEDQAQDQMRPLNGSLDLNRKSVVRETYLSPDQWIPLNGSIWPRLAIATSCHTMHCGKFVCLLSTKCLPLFSLKQHIGQYKYKYHRLQDKHIIWEYLHQFCYVLNIILQSIGWEISWHHKYMPFLWIIHAQILSWARS